MAARAPLNRASQRRAVQSQRTQRARKRDAGVRRPGASDVFSNPPGEGRFVRASRSRSLARLAADYLRFRVVRRCLAAHSSWREREHKSAGEGPQRGVRVRFAGGVPSRHSLTPLPYLSLASRRCL